MLYKEILPREKSKPVFQISTLSQLQLISFVLRFSFSIKTWLAIGATLQAGLFFLPVPKVYTIAPCMLYLLYQFLYTCLVSTGLLPNTLLKGAIPYKFTAIVPDKYGNFPAEGEIPTKEKIAVLLLCARINHPVGWLGAPHAMKFGELFEKMNEDLMQQPQLESGFLGQTQAFMPTPEGPVESLNFSYWRSKEHILKFAESPTHREALTWWSELGGYDGKGGKIPHIGIAHEIYECDAGHWENIYSGFQPTMMAATSVLKPGSQSEKGSIPDEWVRPIIEARRGKLGRSRGRLGISVGNKQDEEAW